MSTPTPNAVAPLSEERVREIRNGFDDFPVVGELIGHIDALEEAARENWRERREMLGASDVLKAANESLLADRTALSARVAELERERDAAIADTREQAAKVCENRAETLPPIESNEARKCARAIRAKGFASPFRPVRRCDCASCLAARLYTYAQTCCPNGLTHGAGCACGGGTIQSLREFDAEGHKR